MSLRLAAACLAALSTTAWAQQADLADLSLEELGNLRVTSASLRPERYSDVPASLFVITNEDIRRSGSTSLMEALRLAPNLEVARVSGTSWAISARGFMNVITNKLLVLLDGRTLYTTVLSGVLWDAQDVMLEDVDRIEVISGPGAALFGANAFVGVINIITRDARETRGTAVTAGGGRLSRDASARYGAALGDGGAFRIYGQYNDRDNLRPEASHVVDQMRKATFGFRADYGWAGDHFQLQGDTYDATVTGNGAPEMRLRGANAVANWSRDLGGESHLNIRAWYDHSMRNDPVTFIDTVDTFDIEGQYDLRPWHGNRISLGLGYRNADDRTEPSASVRFIPQNRQLVWRSAFAQDEIQLTPTLSATLGARAQSGVFTGGEFLPDARLSWKPAADHMTWLAVSRVARTPGRIDRDFFFPANPPFLIRGGPDFQSERGTVYEVGHRASPTPKLTWSVALFHQDLNRLRGGALAPDGAGFLISNEIEGRSNGLEAWLLYQASERWRLMAGWLELNQDLHTRPGSTDFGGPAALGNDPRHTFKARSSYRVSSALDVDASFRYVSALAYLTTVPAYGALDLRLAWHATKAIELSVEGTDLTRSSHVEFDEHGLPAHIPRAVYGQVRLAF